MPTLLMSVSVVMNYNLQNFTLHIIANYVQFTLIKKIHITIYIYIFFSIQICNQVHALTHE